LIAKELLVFRLELTSHTFLWATMMNLSDSFIYPDQLALREQTIAIKIMQTEKLADQVLEAIWPQAGRQFSAYHRSITVSAEVAQTSFHQGLLDAKRRNNLSLTSLIARIRLYNTCWAWGQL
jgi:hypothetical protein